MSNFATYPSLKDSVVLVTGGASGIGADIVRAFHHNKARVAFIDILDDDAGHLEAECKGAIYFKCDLFDIDALRTAIADVKAELGNITVLVNNAANDRRSRIEEVGVEDWDWSQNINLRHQFFAAQAVHPQMREAGGGSIINFSSIAWRFGADTIAPYAVAKSGVIGLTKALARNFGPDNIRVNAIEPGAVMTEKQLKLWYPTKESVDAIVNRQLIQRMLTGDEIARAVLFLASDDSRMITKQSLIVDAGLA
jgi:D-xylose 1-dehydrogenase